MLKNKILIIFSTIMILVCPYCGYGSEKTTGKVAATLGLRIRSGPGTSYDKIITVPYSTYITILSYEEAGNGCDDKWVEIIYEAETSSYKGYVCSTYIEDVKTEDNEGGTTQDTPKDDQNTGSGEEDKDNEGKEDEDKTSMENMSEEEFEKYLTDQGFPESYKVKLRAIHKLHPSWKFVGVKTKYTWNSTLKEQNEVGMSFYNVNPTLKSQGYEGYLSTEPGNYVYETDTFINHDGLYWYQANSQAIAYFMDPRNYLDERKIFAFENLLYDPEYQNAAAVNKILTTSFMQQFTNFFMEAAKTYNISPLYLAALSRQEVGLTDSNIVINGKAGVLEDGVNYTGYYNFFNIGASSSSNPKLKSLQYAKSKEWNTQQKAILGGAKFQNDGYINCGQYTSYFYKFNVSDTATKEMWHQYHTNIGGLSSPAITTYNSYVAMNIIDLPFTFSIPIYSGMPDSTTLPPLGNPNNYLSDLKVNGKSMTNFSGSNTNYTVTVPYSEEVKIEGKTVNAKAKIDGIGTFELKEKETKFAIKVTAQNGDVRNYNVTIKREEKPEVVEPPVEDGPKDPIPPITGEEKLTAEEVLANSGYIHDDKYVWNVVLTTNVSGMINKVVGKYKTISVNIKNSKGNSKTEGTVVTGDKLIIEVNNQTKTYDIVIYGDTNGDGMISAIDLLNVQKHILGYTSLLGAYAKAADTNKDSKISGIDLLNVQKQLIGYSNISQK